MWAYLWTKSKEAPLDYLELFLCRDLYHCPPSEIPKQNARTVFKHLNMLKVEMDVEELRKK